MFLWGGIMKKGKRSVLGGGGELSNLTSENIPQRIGTLWQEQLSPTRMFAEKVTAGDM